jgi:hypothetical protein
MTQALQKAGVAYISGDAGRVVQLLFDEKLASIGARGADGTSHFAALLLWLLALRMHHC